MNTKNNLTSVNSAKGSRKNPIILSAVVSDLKKNTNIVSKKAGDVSSPLLKHKAPSKVVAQNSRANPTLLSNKVIKEKKVHKSKSEEQNSRANPIVISTINSAGANISETPHQSNILPSKHKDRNSVTTIDSAKRLINKSESEINKANPTVISALISAVTRSSKSRSNNNGKTHKPELQGSKNPTAISAVIKSSESPSNKSHNAVDQSAKQTSQITDHTYTRTSKPAVKHNIKKNTTSSSNKPARKDTADVSNNRTPNVQDCILVDGQFDNEIRIAHITNGILVKYQHHSSENESLYGNIYYGNIHKQYKHLNAAFVDIGDNRHGFIQNFKESRNFFQVTKDPKGKKCASLTKNITINGRYLILHPYADLKQLHFNNPDGAPLCFTLKYKTQDINQEYLQKDAERLYKIWSAILNKVYSQPGIVYRENDVLHNVVKSADYSATMMVEGKDTYNKICKIANEWAPDLKIKLYNRAISLFQYYAIETKILDLQLQQMPLASGGSITINQTEAMIAIDINSGKSQVAIYKVNLEAAVLIAEQIKLRNLSGLIIVDFIDMQDAQQKTELYQKMKELLEEDYSYTKITQIPNTGTMEVTRQRVLPSISENISVVCDRCDGNGFTLSTNCAAMQFLRNIRDQFAQNQHTGKTLEIYTTQEIGQFLLNHCRSALTQIEQRYNKIINIRIGENSGRLYHK